MDTPASFQFDLADFIPYYTPPHESSSVVYPQLPKSTLPNSLLYSSFLAKQEFSTLQLSAKQEKASDDSTFLKEQELIARFLSPKTPYNRFLAFHGVGTGKCVHPNTHVLLASPVSIFQTHAVISQLWSLFHNGMIISKDGGEWATPKQPIHVVSFNTQTQQLESKPVLRLYREYVKTALKVYRSGNYQLCCTQLHKLLTPQGFESNLFQPKPVLLCQHDRQSAHTITQPITQIEDIWYEGYVYDLEVADTHTYIANGFITHNTCIIAAVGEKARELNPQLSRVIVITKSVLKNQVIRDIAKKCTAGKYLTNVDPSNDLEVKKAIQPYFEVLTLTEFCQLPEVEDNIRTIGDKDIQSNEAELNRAFNGAYLIIDEAHNVVPSETGSGRRTAQQYRILHRLIQSVKGLKLLLLTATPMINDPYEIVPLLNLLLPSYNQITEPSRAFIKKWFDAKHKLKQPQKFLQQYLTGTISYLRSALSDVDVLYEGHTLPAIQIEHTKLVTLRMSEHQSRISYQELLKDQKNTQEPQDTLEKSTRYGLAQVSRHCSNIVFPDGSSQTSGELQWLTLQKSESGGQAKILSYRCNPAFRAYLRTNGADPQSMLNQLRLCSVKMAYLIDIILNHPREKVFVYSDFILGGGCILLGALLMEFGFDELPRGAKQLSQLNRAKRFIIYASDLPERDDKLPANVLNHIDNLYGDYVQVIIGGKMVGEGISFYHIRHMFVLNPYFNMATLDQAIGRAVRTFGHSELPENQRNIRIYRLCAQLHQSYTDVVSIDEDLYQLSEAKDVKIKQIEHLLKQASIDCRLTAPRNRSSRDQDGSRACDYQSCQLSCYPHDIPAMISPISDTYNLLYGEREMKGVIRLIKQLFRVRFAYDFYEILYSLRHTTNDPHISTNIEPYLQNLSSILLARSLYFIIVNNIVITNRHGFSNYLREDRNLYFLTDDPNGSSPFSLGWYAEHPFPDESLTPTQAIQSYYSSQFDILYATLLKHLDDDTTLKRIVDNAPLTLIEPILEQAFATVQTRPASATPLSTRLYHLYSKFIIRYQDSIVHTKFAKPRILKGTKWITLTPTQFEDIKQKGTQDQEYTINRDLANTIGIEAYIPIDASSQDKFADLHIKRKRLIRILASGKVDARQDRAGNQCGTHKDYSATGCMLLLFEMAKWSKQYGLRLPLTHLTQQVEDLESDVKFIKDVKDFIQRWDMIQQIAQHLLDTRQVVSTLFPLRTHFTNKNKMETFCSGLGIPLEQCHQNEIPLSTKDFTLKEVTDLLHHYSDSSLVIKQLFDKTLGRRYTDADYLQQLTPEVRQVLSKAILLSGPELCQSIGMWFEQNKLLGTS